MPLEETLARVDTDLAAGRVPLARQRLRGLVASFPHDPALRRRLAEVYRLYGDAAEAGRWTYLEEDRDADETAAFEARYASPRLRMRALAWRGPETTAATPFAEARLRAVRTACAEESGHPVDWDDPDSYRKAPEEPYETPTRTADRVRFGIGCLVASLVFIAFIAVWVVGVVALFD
ncbi:MULTISPECIES: DUF6584 family protein [unclassified Streptomyces]|uniref:DUF6584 family protein n=1 Tax=unclassified Streptomyces TaxID=2593676 RepID=UPI0016613623|nr:MULTISPECIES: DUF6584 family protein [unclassified Streptomyces]MBD0711948.1 hypothetical protein [Streptomyces sp. CBMA291]MBD0713290.1 hypothetical protein [Streptomyces sp. CBMA370]